jgi:hypothetical protein
MPLPTVEVNFDGIVFTQTINPPAPGLGALLDYPDLDLTLHVRAEAIPHFRFGLRVGCSHWKKREEQHSKPDEDGLGAN